MTAAATRSRRVPKTTDARKADRATKFAALTEMVDNFDLDEMGAAVQRRYDALTAHYSERNTILILSQYPKATRLRMYNGWKQEGRQVRKGERGIAILAPAGQSDRDAIAEPTDPAAPIAARRFFKLITVFDIRQTDPTDAS